MAFESQKTRFPVDWTLLVEELIANIGIPLDSSGFCRFDDFGSPFFPGFGSSHTSILCILGELAGGGFMAVAVNVTDRARH